MKLKKINTIFKALVPVIFALSLVGCATNASDEADKSSNPATSQLSDSSLQEVTIGFPSSGGNWPSGVLGVAITNGYLDQYLKPLGYYANSVGFTGAAPAINEALVAQELDYVVYAGMAADLSKANGIDQTLFAATSWGASWKLIARSDANINSIEDLKGKKVAYTRGASPHMYLIKVLNEAGLTFNSVEAINSSLPEALAGISSGGIDAAVVTSGNEAELVEAGQAVVIHNQFTSDSDVYYEPMVYIARSEYHNEHEDVSVAIQKAFLKARDWIKEDPDRYYQLVSSQTGYPLEYVLETANYNIDEAFPLSTDVKYVDYLKNTLTFLQQNELTTGNIDFDTWINTSVAQKALEEYTNEKTVS